MSQLTEPRSAGISRLAWAGPYCNTATTDFRVVPAAGKAGERPGSAAMRRSPHGYPAHPHAALRPWFLEHIIHGLTNGSIRAQTSVTQAPHTSRRRPHVQQSRGQSRIRGSGAWCVGHLVRREDVCEQERDQRCDQGLPLLHRARQPLRRPRSLQRPEANSARLRGKAAVDCILAVECSQSTS